MQLDVWAPLRCQKTYAEIFQAVPPLAVIAQAAAPTDDVDETIDHEVEMGRLYFSVWDVAALGAAPTDAEIDAALAAPTPVPVPDAITDRQFARQAAIEGLCSKDEAKAWVASGTLPSVLTTLVAALPAAQQFDADMFLMGATEFHRTHPMTVALTSAFGWDDAKRAQFWTDAKAGSP